MTAQPIETRIVTAQPALSPATYTAELIRRATAAGCVSLTAYVEALEDRVRYLAAIAADPGHDR